MPLYEYECDSCKKVMEIVQKFADAPLTACPECGQPVRKLMSLGSFALKGTGWYTSDYKRAGQKPDQKPDQKSESSSSNTTSTPTSPPASAAPKTAAPKSE